MAQYFLQVLATLAIVLLTKRLFARPRPLVPTEAKRMVDLRSKETNCSWPSGDAAQASLFVFFIAFNFPYFALDIGGLTMLKFIAMVAIGRVFHHCHYFGDTIGGALIGYFVAVIFFNLDIIVPVPAKWDRALAALTR